jgi:O-antigen/teichoic acid export membrane protein
MLAIAKAHLRRLLPTKAFARGVSVLVGGTATAQLITILAAPLLTRLYSPEDFGLLAVYASLLALIGVIASLRYEVAIPLPDEDAEAANIVALCLILVGSITLFTAILVYLAGPDIADALGVPALAGYLWLLPLGVLLSGAYNVFNYWSLRTKRFATIAGTKLRQALTTLAIQLAAFKLGGVALLFGQVAGQSIGTTSLGRPALGSAGFRQVSWFGIAKAAARYRRFPIFSTWGGIAYTAGLQLPPMLFAALFGPAAAGLYALAHRLLTLPMTLVGGAIGQVFFANAAEAHRVGQLAPLVNRVHSTLSNIGLPAAILLFLIGPHLFTVLLGEQWREAGTFARWMAPWLYFQFVSAPLSAAIFSTTETQHYSLAFHAAMSFLRLLAIGIGALLGGILTAVIIMSVVSSLSYIGLLIMLAKISGVTVEKIAQNTLSSLWVSLLISLPILLAFLTPDPSLQRELAAYSLAFGMLVWRYWLILRETYQ